MGYLGKNNLPGYTLYGMGIWSTCLFTSLDIGTPIKYQCTRISCLKKNCTRGHIFKYTHTGTAQGILALILVLAYSWDFSYPNCV